MNIFVSSSSLVRLRSTTTTLSSSVSEAKEMRFEIGVKGFRLRAIVPFHVATGKGASMNIYVGEAGASSMKNSRVSDL